MNENKSPNEADAIGKNVGQAIGKYLKEYGFDIDFAPVADVNTNPNNIVIGNRAFGSDPTIAAGAVSGVLAGLAENGIVGCLKHFPGHGDTTGDTHEGYVRTDKTWEQLANCEMIPFRAGVQAGAKMVMTAHIAVPNVTGEEQLPSTLSGTILQDKLRGELGFDGVIVSDAMSMGAIHNEYSSGEAAVKAFLAGCDILLMPFDYIEAYQTVLEAVKNGTISESRLNESVKRIMKLKK
jgi:beta-N-acetylhexosaminidase